MTAACVLDASALLALLHDEPGGDAVAVLLPAAAVSAVNWSEVVQKALARGVTTSGLSDEMRDLGVEIAPFTAEEAEAAAELWTTSAPHLSLGDRACLAAARLRGVPAVTADRRWMELQVGVEVRPIR